MESNSKATETPSGIDLRSAQPRTPAAHVTVVRLDTLDPDFDPAFERYKSRSLSILSHSFDPYYGDDYHLKRIVEGRSIIYLALIGPEEPAAISYVKRNLRRGVTAVYPDAYRRTGLAETLVAASFVDFPEQYSIFSVSNTPMMRLLLKLGFDRARSVEEVEEITKDEFPNLSDFAVSDDGIVFKRHSRKRGSKRETLVLLYRRGDACA